MYVVMHRTQMNLEDWQYQTLRARAEREGRSLSDLVREAVSRYLAAADGEPVGRLAELRGIGDDAEATGAGHDRFLYDGREKR